MIASTGRSAEGVKSSESVLELARQHGVEMPITEVMVAVVHDGLEVGKAAVLLASRTASRNATASERYPRDAAADTPEPGERTAGRQRKIRVAVIFGGQGPEHSVSCLGAREHALGAIDRDSYEVIPVGITPTAVGAGADGPAAGPDRRRAALRGGGGRAGPQRVPWAAPASGGRSRVSRPGQIPKVLGEVDVVLPMLHGPFGEDGTHPGPAGDGRGPVRRLRACWPARSAWTRST